MCARDSTYVLDGLLYHESDLRISSSNETPVGVFDASRPNTVTNLTWPHCSPHDRADARENPQTGTQHSDSGITLG